MYKLLLTSKAGGDLPVGLDLDLITDEGGITTEEKLVGKILAR